MHITWNFNTELGAGNISGLTQKPVKSTRGDGGVSVIEAPARIIVYVYTLCKQNNICNLNPSNHPDP
jgi:hypothetical protein